MAQLLVFSNAKDGRDDDYNEWYDSIHLPDMLGVPGVKSGARYRVRELPGRPSEHKYLAVYELDRDAGEVLKEIGELMASDPSRATDSLDFGTVVATVWERQ
ncbi:hypothetical protein FPZ12_042280 [Amycolatopsis acidicola]|uniref:DUF4286 family protein n=1 Tax=Amycolatopsis acidicola TaxID=2596893 RepID=A0A5N0ULC8_9PSEU|nr:DUF4286 family protein [Amycolatopsis acidicola]KAA9149884.1 hypothetical protein FPZ12_042280 [Amycolatopsis acidicola]